MNESMMIFFGLLFVVAMLYASVGHGGASGYLALMALFGFSQSVMKPTALLLNLFVSLTAFIHFYRNKYFLWQIFLPLALASVPMSFVGGTVAIEDNLYKKILGALLLFPVGRFLFLRNAETTENKSPGIALSLLIGGSIGLFSGMIGIGGGIILSPVLLLLRWTDQKQTAAISALFIFVNSIAGLAGQLIKGIEFTSGMYGYVAVAFAGGLCGSWLGAARLPQAVLKNILAGVLMLASFKLLFTQA
jgi:uncharacterized membrane protein YfcA